MNHLINAKCHKIVKHNWNIVKNWFGTAPSQSHERIDFGMGGINKTKQGRESSPSLFC